MYHILEIETNILIYRILILLYIIIYLWNIFEKLLLYRLKI